MKGFDPGPWESCSTGKSIDDGADLAVIWPKNAPWKHRCNRIADVKGEGNIKLIRKAPDMHAALLEVIDAIEGYVDIDEPTSDGHERPNWAMSLTTLCKQAIGEE